MIVKIAALTPIYTGNPFETPTLTQETSYWLREAVSPNGCISERAEVILIIDPEEKPYFDLSKRYIVSILMFLPYRTHQQMGYRYLGFRNI